MENTDNTLREMQQQMQQLREKLANEKIVNDRMLRTSFRKTVNQLNTRTSLPIAMACAGLAFFPLLRYLGFSWYFLIFTDVMLLVAIVAMLLTRRHIPCLDNDLVTAASEITTFRKINADWIKYGIPCLVVWVGLLAWDVIKNVQLGRDNLYGFVGGAVIGLIIGGAIGLKNRREILNGSDELLDQIEELRRDA